MSLLNRTSKRLEHKNMEKTFDSFSPEEKNVTIPQRELLSERSFKDRVENKQAFTLFNSLQVRKEKLKGSPKKFKFTSG